MNFKILPPTFNAQDLAQENLDAIKKIPDLKAQQLLSQLQPAGKLTRKKNRYFIRPS